MMKLNKHTKLKLKVMRALQDDEERQLQKELLGALIDDSTPDEEDFAQPAIRDAQSVPELPQGAVAQLSEPAQKVEAQEQAESAESENQTNEAEVDGDKTQEPSLDGDENKAA